MRTFRKDTTETQAFGFDWSPKLNGDAIANSYWIVDEGITVSGSFSGPISVAKFSGGDVGEQYRAENRIVTSSGMVYERSFIVQVADR